MNSRYNWLIKCGKPAKELLKTLNVSQSISPLGITRYGILMSVYEYMERYNDEHPHVTLRYKTPSAYEQAYYEGRAE